MGRRRKEKLLDTLIRMPWWVGIGGAALLLALRPAWLAWATSGAGMFAPMMVQLSKFAYFVAFVFAIGGIASLVRQWWNGRLLDKQAAFMDINTTPNAKPAKIAPRISNATPDLDWREFESVIQEAFRRQGYLAVETQTGADGGYDIALRKDGKLYLVQCKHWKAQKVGVSPVRELFGVIAARGAAGGFFVTSGYYTEDAKAFAAQTKLKLIDGPMFKKLIAQLARSKPAADIQPERIDPVVTLAPDCPNCGAEMIERVAKKGANAGKEFWGCSEYPRCWRVVG